MRLLGLSAFFLPLLGWAQSPSEGLLWRIDGQGLSHPSFVVGTVHSRDARAFQQVPLLLELLQKQDALAGELDLTSGVEGLAGISPMAMMLPADTSLADLLPPEKVDQVGQALTSHLGAMAFMADRLKPFYIMGLLSQEAMRNDSAVVLDQYLQIKAVELGKDVVGVETVEEQMRAVDALSLQEQADMLVDLLEHDLYQAEMEQMMEAYAAEDLEALARIAEEASASEAMNTHLLEQRNQLMAIRLDSLMQGGRTFLFALGAAHLPGPTGVLARLQTMGYRAEPWRQPEPGLVIPE